MNEFDREFIGDTFKPLSPEDQARWDKAQRRGNGGQTPMKKTLQKTKTSHSVPPPPGHEEYGIDELLKAGHLDEVPLEEQRKVKASAAFLLLCKCGLQVKLSRRDCKHLAELAASRDEDVETLVKGLVKEHLNRSNSALRNGAE